MSSRESLRGMGIKEIRRQGEWRRVHRQLIFHFRDCRGALHPHPLILNLSFHLSSAV